jgi:Domain of unknown function (DUF1840)
VRAENKPQRKEKMMTITFKSDGSVSIEMKEKNAQELLEFLGKNPNETRGVFSPDQLAVATDLLKNLIKANAGRRRMLANAEIDEKAGEVFEVDISLRAMPLLELFELSKKSRKPVTWGI